MKIRSGTVIALALILLSALQACTYVPEDSNNLCRIFRGEPDWYDAARAAEKKWAAPIALQMAIMRYESDFRDDARPPRRWFLGVVPLGRPSSAYGYAQALDGTWASYIKQTGNWGADRDDFDDATDFIGWYLAASRRELGIARTDAFRHYLVYHEGAGGYKRKTHRKKKWLLRRARQVKRQYERYGRQLASCRAEFE